MLRPFDKSHSAVMNSSVSTKFEFFQSLLESFANLSRLNSSEMFNGLPLGKLKEKVAQLSVIL